VKKIKFEKNVETNIKVFYPFSFLNIDLNDTNLNIKNKEKLLDKLEHLKPLPISSPAFGPRRGRGFYRGGWGNRGGGNMNDIGRNNLQHAVTITNEKPKNRQGKENETGKADIWPVDSLLKDDGDEGVDIYESLGNALIHFLQQINLTNQISLYLPKDDLISLSSALISFLGEYNTTALDLVNDDIRNIILTNIHYYLFRIKDNFDNERERILLFTKIKLIKLLSTNITEKSKIRFKRMYSYVKMFEEIFSYMNKLLQNLKTQGIIKNNIEVIDINVLINLYINHKEFEKSFELKYCISVFKFIKLLQVKFNMISLDQYFRDNREMLIDKKSDNNTIYGFLGLTYYDFFNEIIPSVEVTYLKETSDVDNKGPPQFVVSSVFFTKFPITYFLSNQTKQDFLDNVDRSSGGKKVAALMENSIYFLYEMFYNYDLAINTKSGISQLFQLLKIENFELINYCFIIIHQILLLNYFIKKSAPYEFEETEKFVMHNGNLALAVIQIVFLFSIIAIWIRYYLPLLYQRLIMNEYVNKLFSVSPKDSLKFGDNFIKENKDRLATLNNEVAFLDKLKILIFEIIINNRMINTLIGNLILLILYFCIQNTLLLIIPVLFIANLVELLHNIVYAVKLKWKQLALIILFIYIIVYLFSWIGFLYLYQFYFTDVLVDSDINNPINENLCSNAFQCWINSINYGVRAGGGIGDVIGKASFYQGSESFAKLFIFNIAFHIIIVLILGNIFLGIIVDTFAELRDEKQKFENDTNNICFICQLTREASTAKIIDFDEHITKSHFIWTYLDFIVYLLLSKPNNFSKMELEAYNKLKQRNTTWMPISE
jgi:hypothetical protein